MSDGKRFVGRHGTYALPSAAAIPQAIGRASLIYRATDEQGDDVCVKVYKDPDANPGPYRSSAAAGGDATAVFGSELEAYRELVHPNILHLVDYGHDEETGTLFLVLPWCEGGDLRRAMQRRQFYSVTDALQLLRPVALALDYAHSRGFVHGDVKPENVLFDVDRSHPFLSDFGSTRRAAYDERISAAGAGRGTTIYLSPEQIRDSAATASSDVYAFGMVAYEMLTGRMPVDEREPAFKQMIAKIEGRLLPAGTANGQLPKHVAGALMAALAVDPRDRPATTSQLCAMLAGELALPRPSRAFGRRRLTTSQRAAIITATIAAIGTIVVAVIESLPRWRESSAPAATQAGQPRR